MIRGDEMGKGINTSAGGSIALEEATMETETPGTPDEGVEAPEPQPEDAPNEDDAPSVSEEAAEEVDKQAEPMGEDVPEES